MGRTAGAALAGLLIALALAGDRVAPNAPSERFDDFAWAPPTPLTFENGELVARPLRLRDRLSRTFDVDESTHIPLRWFADGRMLSSSADAPVLLLGADALGRDVLARLAAGARWSLGVAVAAAALAVFMGLLLGTLAASGSRAADQLITGMGTALATLPAVYIVLTLRAALPLVLTAWDVSLALVLLFGLVGWPLTARGVRAILLRERARDYAEAARAAGAGRARLLRVHLAPAASGFLLTQFLILVPGFLMSEVTLSFLGLGFPEPTPSWGTMLQDASSLQVMNEAPWMLAPAAAIALTSLALHLTAGPSAHRLTAPSRAR